MAGAGDGVAVCVAGMHRSGTSMVARILMECGVHLGDPDELLPATAANTEGHFEHGEIVALNDAVLATLGGAWDLPPGRIQWLARGRRLRALGPRGASILAALRTGGAWGWKDPRTSLTLRFWRPLVPELRVVACVRDVVAVAHSLAQRGHSSELFSMRLWTAYNRELLRTAPKGRTLFVSYERFFADPEREVARLVRGVGLPPDADAIAKAAATIDRRLRHHAVDYDPAGLPRPVARCRERLLALVAD